ncbi:MAG: acetyltransferase family protein [Planctomycetaceae bacterium]|nr:acetyltransferase family protein [Planctomycetaceae bacterium]
MSPTVDIHLRELEHGDLAQLNSWRNDPEVVDWLGNNFLFISRDVDDEWFRSYLANRDRALRLTIIVTKTGEYIGNVNLTSIHPINRSAEFSILIGERRYWSQGIGRQASEFMLRHAFNDLNLNRVYLSVLSHHERAIRLYYHLGFAVEGNLREAIFKHGLFFDLQMMSILKSEFALKRA